MLGRKNLSLNYRTGNTRKEHKKAIRQFHNEVQSAQLPEIHTAVTSFKTVNFKAVSKERSLGATSNGKKVEYIHEEFYDTESKGKWTIFNKHALEIRDEAAADASGGEDAIIDKMILDEKNNNANNVCALPESTWVKLYDAKCRDLEITCRSDKQQERFVTQMLLHQRSDRINLKD